MNQRSAGLLKRFPANLRARLTGSALGRPLCLSLAWRPLPGCLRRPSSWPGQPEITQDRRNLGQR